MPLLPARKSRAYEGPECPRCRTTLPAPSRQSGEQSCGYCRGKFSATWFAPLSQDAGGAAAAAGLEGTVACAVHAGNLAESACGRCGIFMCSLCRVDVDGKVLCTTCFEKLTAEGALTSTVRQLRYWKGSAMTCLVLGLVTFFFLPIFGAAALYYARKGIAQKRADRETAEIRDLMIIQVLAIAFAALGLAMWLLVIPGWFE